MSSAHAVRYCQLLWLLLAAVTTSNAWARDDMAALAALRAESRYEAAADLGLRAILDQPWDHSLRYLVADSLERANRLDEAAAQFSALLGTPLQGAAQGRLATFADHAHQAPPMASTSQQSSQPQRPETVASTSAKPHSTAPAAGLQPKALGTPALPRTAVAAPRGQPQSLAPPPTTLIAGAPKKLGSPAISSGPKTLGSPAVSSGPKTLGSSAADTRPSAPPAPKPPPGAAGLVEALYAKGDYSAAGQEGLNLLATQQPPNAELHLKIANALAWGGQVAASQDQYAALFGSAVDRQARIGLANTQRWNGRPDLAISGYQSVLSQYPDDPDARDGLRLTRLELAPRTTISLEQAQDINPIKRHGAGIAQRWNNEAGDTAFEVRLSGVEDSSLTPALAIDRRVLFASVERRAAPLQPQLSLSLQQQSDNNNVFGSARIKLHDLPVWLRATRLDWGHESLSPRAGAAGLIAWQAGIETKNEFSWGQLSTQANYYNISDGNSINAAQVQWVPTWRPLGAHWRPYVALDYREAKRPTLEYWSPSRGHGSAGAGLSGNWSRGRWDLYGSAQYAFPLLVESGNAWSLSLGGRFRISPDLALSFNYWRMSSQRNNAQYRARSAAVQLEKTWQ